MKKKTDDLPIVDFPKNIWLYRPVLWGCWRKWSRPITFGADEFGRHVLFVGVPGIIGVAYPYKMCGPGCVDYDDEDFGMKDLQCHFPGCPLFSMGGIMDGSPKYCLVHDEEFWSEYIEEAKNGRAGKTSE